MIDIENKKLTVITGHYGCGKTNFSVNLALDAARSRKKCTIIDLDIVNPYFRTADLADMFEREGIELWAPVYAGTNLDIPSLNIPLASILESGADVIIDVGGDDEGAKALGRFAPTICTFADTQILYVINKYRYLTKEPADAVQVMREIEYSAGLSCTGIVNNSNLGTETTAGTVEASLDFANEVSKLSGLPLCATAMPENAVTDKAPCPYKVKVYIKAPWQL